MGKGLHALLFFAVSYGLGTSAATVTSPPRQPAQEKSSTPLPPAANTGEEPAPLSDTPPEQAVTPPAASEPPPPPHTSEEDKPSASSGEPIFDWSKHQGETEVAHPFAEKGLIRIGKDDTYYYKVDETVQHYASSFQLGLFDPHNLSNPNIKGQRGSTFADNYDNVNGNPQFLINKEWHLWRGALGKLGLQVGTGAFIAQGHGHFVSDVNANLTPLENFTFIAVPINAGVVYRMQFMHRQLFVPFAAGGGTVYAFAETRDDNKPPKFGGSFAAYVAAGCAFNMTYFDYLTRVQLNHEYGINAIYLTLEDRQTIGIDQRYDFTSNFLNAGFLMEY